MIFFIITLHLFYLNIPNNQGFIPYNKLEKLSNNELIMIFKDTNINDTENKILTIIRSRDLKKENFKIKLNLVKRINLVKNLNIKSIELIKYNPYYFIPLSYIENIFTNKDRKYLFKILQNAIKTNDMLVIQRVFSLRKITNIVFFNAIIFMKSISIKNKIFFTYSLLDSDINIKNKIKIKCFKKLYEINNNNLLNNILYLLPKFFSFKDSDLLLIYKKLNTINKIAFLKSLVLNKIKLPQKLIKIIDLNNKYLFLLLLKYSNKNKHKIKRLKNKLKKIRITKDFPIKYINLYINNEIFIKIIKNNEIFIEYLKNIIDKNEKNNFLDKYSIKNYKNLKLNVYIRVLLTKYTIVNKLLKNIEILKFIISLFKNKKLEYKSDEYYISIILPLLSNYYNKNNYIYYKKLLKMINRTAIESTLEAISISNDKRFIIDLKALLKEREIKDLVENTIWKLNNF